MKTQDLFDGYFNYRAGEGNSLKTLQEHRRFLFGPVLDALKDRELEKLNLTVRAELMDAGKPYGFYGSQRTVVYFRQLLQYAQMIGIKMNFHWRDLKVPHVPENRRVEYLTPEELNKIRSCFDLTDSAGLRTRVMMELMLDLGLRIGEICSLNMADLNMYTGLLKFKNCKTKDMEEMKLNDNALEWIKAYLKTRTDDLPCMFVSGRGRLLPVTSRNFMHQKTNHLNLGKRIAHHIFRKTCGTNLLNETDIKAVQTHLRHKDPKTTMKHYIGINREECQIKNSIILKKFTPLPPHVFA